MSVDGQRLLPGNWCTPSIGDIAEINPPGAAVNAPDNQPVTFLPMAAVEELSGRIDVIDERTFGQVKKGYTRFKDGDLLFARITPCMENGKIAVARALKNGIGCGSTEFHVVRPGTGVSVDYLRYFVLRSSFREEAKRNMRGAVGQQRVPPNFLREARVALAPTREQARIVSKVNEIFSRIDEGERSLERASTLLERYRQSALKAAVTGELTRDWREQHQGQLESGEALLRRILNTRRRDWEKMNPGKKYREPIPPRAAGLPDLPVGWVWATLDQLCKKITSGSRAWKERYASKGSLLIRAQNIKRDSLEIDEAAFVDPTGLTESARTRVELNDLLVTITGANVTKAALVAMSLPDAYVSQHVALVRPVIPELSLFIYQWVVSPANGRRQLLDASYGAGKPGLSLDDLREVFVALPSAAEQNAINDRLSVAMGQLTRLVLEMRRRSGLCSSLRQTILNAAFSGRLVPQDRNDEPASALLERIAAERAAENKPAPRRPRTKKARRK